MSLWSLLVAGLSFLVSLVTLYEAHLRGPQIDFMVPSNPSLIKSRSADAQKLEAQMKILVFNTGNRPGVLHDLSVISDDDAPLDVSTHWDAPEALPLPLLLPASGEWRKTFFATMYYAPD